MTKNLNVRRKRQAIANRQMHIALSLVGSGVELLMLHPVRSDSRINSALETVSRWREVALSKLDPLTSCRAVKKKDKCFNKIKLVVAEMFPDHEFRAEEWMHFWLAINMQLDCALNLHKVQTGNRAAWRYMERSSMKLVRGLAGNLEHELYEIGSVEDTEPLLGTVVGEALTDIIWSE